jgi:hypothetical protein
MSIPTLGSNRVTRVAGPTVGVPMNPIPQLLNYRGFYGSRYHMVAEPLLDKILATRPFWFLIYDSATGIPGGAIGAQQTDRGQVTVQEDCWLLSLMASSSQAAGFVMQLYDTERKINFMDSDVLNVNCCGTAQKQFFLKEPQKFPSGGQLESRIINLATSPNIIQVVGFGLRPDPRKKVT